MPGGLEASEVGCGPTDPPLEGSPVKEDGLLEELVLGWGDALRLEERRALEARIALTLRAALERRVSSLLLRSGRAAAAGVEDVVHETITELPKILASYLESARPSDHPDARGFGAGFRRYLMGTARNITRDMVGDQRRERERLERMAQSHPSKLGHVPTTPSRRAMRSEIAELLAAEIAKFDPVDRAIAERRREGISKAEIGRELGMPPETVRDRWDACLVRLRRVLGDALGGDPLSD
jgi:RNA polymerase sigma factor (sigma-70 family)